MKPTNKTVQTSFPTKVLLGSLIGTTIEYYDYYLYATATTIVFSSQFFPNAKNGIIAAFATYGIGFLTRPSGAIYAGHRGDKIGRKRLLQQSLFVMGIASTLIGLLPNYHSAGFLSVIGLIFLRLVQGFATGMEWGGSAVLAVEHSRKNNRGLFGSFTQSGSALGMLLSTAVFTIAKSAILSD